LFGIALADLMPETSKSSCRQHHAVSTKVGYTLTSDRGRDYRWERVRQANFPVYLKKPCRLPSVQFIDVTIGRYAFAVGSYHLLALLAFVPGSSADRCRAGGDRRLCLAPPGSTPLPPLAQPSQL
jgi:hypothetical protein